MKKGKKRGGTNRHLEQKSSIFLNTLKNIIFNFSSAPLMLRASPACYQDIKIFLVPVHQHSLQHQLCNSIFFLLHWKSQELRRTSQNLSPLLQAWQDPELCRSLLCFHSGRTLTLLSLPGSAEEPDTLSRDPPNTHFFFSTPQFVPHTPDSAPGTPLAGNQAQHCSLLLWHMGFKQILHIF